MIKAKDLSISNKEKAEIDFWNQTSFKEKGNPFKSISMTAWPTILNRMAEAQVFIEKINTFESFFTLSKNIVELGGGQCWASCMVKLQNPTAHVTGTDIAQAAIDAIPLWERIFEVKIDCAFTRKSYETFLPSGSVDLVFAFSSAHHFGRYRQTILEISRILMPGGIALFLHEPSCHPF